MEFLLLLFILALCAVVALLMYLGFIAVAIALIFAIVWYVRTLIQCWREGKKTVAWLGVIPLAILVLFISAKLIEARNIQLAEQEMTRKKMAVASDQVQACREAYNQIIELAETLPLEGRLELKDEWQYDGGGKKYSLTVKPTDQYLRLVQKFDQMPKSYFSKHLPTCSFFRFDLLSSWKFNGKTFQELFDNNDQYSLSEIGTYPSDLGWSPLTYLYWVQGSPFDLDVTIDGPAAREITQICFSLYLETSPGGCGNFSPGTRTKNICVGIK